MKKMFLLMLATTTLLACAKISTNYDQPSQVAKEGTGQQQTGLQGNWKSTCASSTNAGVTTSTNNHASFSGLNFVFNANTFKSGDCTGVLGSVLEANFTFQTSSSSASDASLFNFEYVLQNMSLLVLDPQTASVFNLMAHCGFTDWGVGQKKDVTGLSCVTGGPVAGAITYSIMKLQASQLQIGKTDGTHNGTSEALRHVTYDSMIYSRVN